MSIVAKTVTITVSTPRGVGCTQAVTSWEETVRIGVLDAGAYAVRVFIDTAAGVATYVERQLAVSEANPAFHIFPAAAPVGSTRPVTIMSTFFRDLADCTVSGCKVPEVRFGSASAQRVEAVNATTLTVAPPPLASGTYDVTISRPGDDRRVIAPFHVYHPNQAPDDVLFETVLIPVSYNGAGAFGSDWRSEIAVRNAGNLPQLAFEIERFEPRATLQLPALPNDDRGILFHPLRQASSHLSYAAFIRDVSREAERWGTELPIVREHDFRREWLDFPVVPFDARYRVALRIYALDVTSGPFGVVITDEAGKRLANPLIQSRAVAPGRPAFASIANLGALTTRTGRFAVRIYPFSAETDRTRFWAFVSVTNNETQQVTLITPQ